MVSLIQGIVAVFSSISSYRSLITLGLLNGAWLEYRLLNWVCAAGNVPSYCPAGLISSCGPVWGRGGGVALVRVLNPGGAVSDLVRLLYKVVAHIRIGDPMLTYGWRLNSGLVPGCCTYAVGGIVWPPLGVMVSRGCVGYNDS